MSTQDLATLIFTVIVVGVGGLIALAAARKDPTKDSEPGQGL